MSTRVSLLAISFAIVTIPWAFWQLRPVRRVAPLAVVQIMVGVLLGPSCFGKFAPGLHEVLFTRPVLSAIDGLSSVGVLLYVFVTGLHLDTALLRRDLRDIGSMAFGSIATPFVLGSGAGLWMLNAVPDALGTTKNQIGFVIAIALCTAVTALPVLAAILLEMDLLRKQIGQTALALAALNDAALWIILAVLLALTARQTGTHGLLLLGVAAMWFGLLTLIIRPLLRPLVEAGEITALVTGVGLAMLSSAASEALGMGYLFGAFAVGVIMPPACRASLRGRLELVSATILLPFFFMSTGLRVMIEPGSAQFLELLAVAVAATVIGKLVGTALPARKIGFSWADSLALGAMMQTKGLMEVVVLGVLHDAGLISTRIFSALVAMALVCTVLTAPVVQLCRWIEAKRELVTVAAP